MTDTIPTPEVERAQAILAGGIELLALVDADNAARQGIGGPLRVAATLQAMLNTAISEYAAAFNLPYGGPTAPQPAQPTGGE